MDNMDQAGAAQAPAMFSTSRESKSLKRLSAGVAVLVLLGTAGSIAWKYLPSEIKFRNMRNASFYEYDFESFLEQYPASHRLNDVDDLLWRQIDANPDETRPWRLYQRLFPRGRHATELDQRLAARKQTQLASLRMQPDFDLAARFLAWFPGSAEVPEVREIMLGCLEKTGARTRNSPPIPVLRRLIQAASNGDITYCQDGDPANSVLERLSCVFQPFGLTLTKSDPGLIRIRQVLTEDNEHPMVFKEEKKVPSLAIRVDLSVQLPGQKQPAWTGSVSTTTPERVEFRGGINDESVLKDAVLKGTLDELNEAMDGAFRYQWPASSLRYWFEFRKFLQWLGQSDHLASAVLARLNSIPPDGVFDSTLSKLHAAYTDSYEYLKSLDDAPEDSTTGISIEPLRKATEFRARIDRRMAAARAKFEPFE